MTSLPHGAELKPAPHKKFRETVVLVPFFGGRKPNLKRHADFLNQIGYDAVIFELHYPPEALKEPLYSMRVKKLGLKHHWADQIEDLLNAIPGKKIIFSFSNPSASAIEAVARRHASDITGMICDGGPTSDLYLSMIQYYTHETPIPTYPLKVLLSYATTLLWSPQFRSIMHHDLESLPRGFRLLSIRGWKDPLIPPKRIDEVFEPHKNLHWQKLGLPQGGHLNGLKDFYDEYTPKVTEFLHEISTAL